MEVVYLGLSATKPVRVEDVLAAVLLDRAEHAGNVSRLLRAGSLAGRALHHTQARWPQSVGAWCARQGALIEHLA